MKVIVGDVPFELGATQVAPTVGITDYSRRVTDEFGVTTVVERSFSRRLSVRMAVPTDQVGAVQRRLADLRATAATWVADDGFAWMQVTGFYKDFDIDMAVPPLSFCTLTVEGLAENAAVTDSGADPAPDGAASTMRLMPPVTVTDAVLSSSSVAEDDYPAWSAGVGYAVGSRVIREHRRYESLTAANIGNDPALGATQWLDLGPTNRWAMFDQALGSVTSATGSMTVTLAPPAPVDMAALLDVVGQSIRVQVTDNGTVVFDRSEPVDGRGTYLFRDLPTMAGISVTVTVAGASGSAPVSVGTLAIGRSVGLGVTGASPTAGITDYSRKEVDDFGAVTIVQRAWSKRMAATTLIRADALDVVASRIAAARAKPALWIGDDGLESLILYGFFKDFGIEAGQQVSKLSLSIEGLSTAAASARPILVDLGTYDTATTYRAGHVIQSGGASWVYIGADAAAGHAPPLLPTEQNAWWKVFARSGTDGAKGDPGADGKDGLPGVPGADGRTTYTHYAYANSPDGVVDFVTGEPGTRAYEGSYTDFSPTDSTSPGAYSWREYRGPPFGMATRGVAVVAGRQIIKNGGADDWDSDAYSTVEYLDGAVASARPGVLAGKHMMFGLNTDPLTDASYGSLDHAWYWAGDVLQAYESGGRVGNFGTCDTSTSLQIAYDGRYVRYLKDGAVRLTRDVGAGKLFYFDSSLATSGSRWDAIEFSAAGTRGVDGKDGLDGTDGLPGAPGANGQTSYVHFAYADSADGQTNFTVGDAEGRTYIGTYTDFTPGDSGNPSAYTWTRLRGIDGANGIPGQPGADGQPSYVHIAYANSADGQTDFDLSDPTGRRYIGVYTDQVLADSTTPAAYTWSLIKGADGKDGLPGAPGADGRTTYTHYAYANSPDGVVDFVTGEPGTRAYEGSYTDFSPTDSTSPGAYSWREYRGPPFGMATRGVAVVAGRQIIKNGGADDWDSDAYSTVGYLDGAVASARPGVLAGKHMMFGLNTDPLTDASYGSLDHAWYWAGDVLQAYESGGRVGNFGTCDTSTSLQIAYDGRYVRYLKDGAVRLTRDVGAGKLFYFDSSLATSGSRWDAIEFSAAGTRGVDGKDGLDGTDGLPGAPGANGQTSYVHFAYADSADGQTNFTVGDAEGRTYIGTYTDFTPGDSGNPSAYTWTRLRGIDGANGIPGQPGADGQPSYVHIAYANSADGQTDFDLSDPTGRRYIGVYTDQVLADSTTPAAYTWSLIKGADGKDGLPGAPGADGRTTYTHYAYANSPDGVVDFVTGEPGTRAYEGSYTDFSPTDSTSPGAYSWREYRGPPFGMATRGVAVVAGRQIIKNGGADDWDSDAYSTVGYLDGAVASARPGVLAGKHMMFGLNTDPLTDASYGSLDHAWYWAGDVLQAYESGGRVGNFGTCDTSTSLQIAYDGRYVRYLKDGAVRLTRDVGAGKLFYFDSSLATSGSRWDAIEFSAAGTRGVDGKDGLDGTDGLPGAPGANGQTSYVHFAYADSADGQTNFTVGDAEGRTYIGTYTDFTPGDSGNPSAYTWTRLRGIDGANGIPGQPGADGQPSYVHIAYANSADGQTDFDLSDPTGRRYIGVYTDQVLADSTTPAAYTWSLIKGADGAPGVSPLLVTAQPAALQLQGDTAGAAVPGSLPAYITNSASRAGVSASITGVTIDEATGCTASVAGDGTSIAITAISTATASVTYTVAAAGLSQQVKVGITVLRAPTSLEERGLNISSGGTSTSYDVFGGVISIQAGSSGKIDTLLSGTYYSGGRGAIGETRLQTKHQYRVPSGSWVDVSGSEGMGSSATRANGGPGEPPENSPGSPYGAIGHITGLNPGTFYEVRALAYYDTSAGTNSKPATGVACVLIAKQVA